MSQADKIYKFGDFQLDPSEQLLLRDGVPIPLKPKVFETLVILVESGGRLVEKEDFMKRLWPDTFASDEALAQNISQLRRALANGIGGSSLIQTVPKRGYRFTAHVQMMEPEFPVESSEPSPRAESTLQVEARNHPQHQSQRAGPVSLRWKRAAFIFAGLALFALALSQIPPPDPRPPQLTAITFSGKVEAGGGIHSIGSLLVFMERNGSQWPLMQTSIGGGGERPFAAPFPNTRILDLSPDRTEWLIGSFTDLPDNMPLWIWPVQGGAPLRVGDITVDSANWFPDGKRIIAANSHEVFSVDRDGRNQRRLFDLQGRAADFHWHPDGSRFRFTLLGEDETHSSLWEASSNGSGLHPVNLGLSPGTPACCGMWMPNGKDYVFTASENQRGDIWVLHEGQSDFLFGSKKPIQLTNGPTAFFGPPVSEGKRLFVFGANFKAAPVRYDQRTGAFDPYLTSESFIDLAFSRDGQWVAYIGEGLTLWRSRPDGSERLQLTTAPMHALRPRWSRDGKQILFVAELPNLSYTAFVVSAAGGAPTQIYKEDKKYRSFAVWSPDEKSIVMDVLAGSTPDEGLTVVNLQTGQISEFPGSRGMRNAHWSPDGRFLAASSDDAKALYLFNPTSQTWVRAASARSVSRMEWSRDGRFLYFQDILDPAEAVFRLTPETLATERVLDFSKPLQAGAVRCGFQGIAPDGSLLASIRRNALDIYGLDLP